MSRFVLPQESTFDINGLPQNGATLDFHNVGLLTDKNTYPTEADALAGTNANTNPVVADASGNFGNIWLVGNYDVTLKNNAGTTIWGPEETQSFATSATSSQLNPLTTAAMQADSRFTTSDVGVSVPETKEFATGEGGGGVYDIISGTGTANGQNILAHDTASISFVLRELTGRAAPDQHGATGDETTSDSDEIIGANASQGAEVTAGSGTVLPAGNTVELESKSYAIDATLDLSRFSSLTSLDEQAWSSSRLLWTGATSSTMITTTSNQTYRDVTIDGDDIAGTVGILWGSDAQFEAYLLSEKMRFQRCDIGAKVSNCFDTRFEQTRFSDNRLGIEIDPDAGPGGFITTLKISRCYITDNTEEGIIDKSAVKPQMLCIGDNTIIEKNGDATHPQIKLNEGQVLSINEVYIEDTTNTATSIEIQDGYIQNAFFNGFSKGIDLGSGNSSILLDNIKFAAGGGPSVTSSGGANANYAHMRRCDFSGTPTLDSRIQIFDGCLGDVPVGVPLHAWVMTGAKPQHGIGSTPAITRDIEAWLHSDAGAVIAANDAYNFDIDIPVGRMADGFTSLTITPQERLDPATSDLVWSVIRVNLTKTRIVVANPTTGSLTLNPLTWLLRMEQFTVINGETGKHDGGANAAVLTNTDASWTTNEHVGKTLSNVTDGSSTTVTANTATTITGILAGGTDDDWDVGDTYRISNF